MASLFKNIIFALYTLWAALAFLSFLILLFVPLALLLPNLHWRRRAGGITVKLFMLFSGMRLQVNGLQNLPSGGCVVVANHCSYLDGPILAAALPSHFSLVIKREAGNIPLVGFFLKRVDHLLVERRNPRQAARDAEKIIQRLTNGDAVGLFAEGTFHAEPGVHSFKPSGFVGATRNNLPVVPVAMQGTRHIWPEKRLTLRPGLVTITILPLLYPSSDDGLSPRQKSKLLAEQARAQIAAHIQEPLV